MSLHIGELVGHLLLDDSDYERGLKEAPEKAERAGSKIGKVLGAAGAAGGTALAVGLAQSISAEPARDKLAAQLGLVGDEAERAGKLAGTIYRDNFGDSVEEVSGAIGAVISSIHGMRTASDADVKAVTESALGLSQAFEIDVARSVQIAGQLITTGLAKDAPQALDLLTTALQRVPAAVREDLLDALDEYGPFLHTLGIQGEQAFGLLVKASEKGMYGIDKTGDALKEFTIRATDMSAASKVGFDTLGLSQVEMTRQILAGGDKARGAFDKIVTGLLGIKDPAKQSQAALALFGTPLEDLNVSEIPAFLKSLSSAQTAMDGSAGAAEKLTTTLGDNAAGKIETYRRKLLGMAQGAVESTGPTAALAGAVVAFGPAVLSTLAPIAQLVAARSAMAASATAAAAAEVEVGAASTIALGPIGLIVIGIAALVAGLIFAWKHSEKFRDIVTGAVKVVGKTFLSLVDAYLWGFEKILQGWSHLPDWLGGGKATQALGAIRDLRAGIRGMKEDLDRLGQDVTRVPIVLDVKTVVGKAVQNATLSKLDRLDGARAGGGPARAGKAYLVGEHEAEVFVPDKHGHIYNQRQIHHFSYQAAQILGAWTKLDRLDAQQDMLARRAYTFRPLDVNRNIRLDTSQIVDKRSKTDPSRGHLRLHPDDVRAIRGSGRPLHFHTNAAHPRELIDEAVFANRSGRLD